MTREKRPLLVNSFVEHGVSSYLDMKQDGT